MDYSLNKDIITNLDGKYKYSDKIVATISKNKAEIQESEFVKEKLGIFGLQNFEKKFTVRFFYR